VVGDLPVQELDTTGQGAQAGRDGGGFGVPVGPQPQPPTGGDELAGGQTPKPPAERIGSGEDESVQLALGVGGGLDRAAARGQSHLKRRALAGRSGLSELITAQGFAGGSGRVQRVGLGAVAAGRPR
jgi:hypothetical protein